VRGFYTLRVDSNTIKEAATAAEEADREFDRMNLAALYETIVFAVINALDDNGWLRDEQKEDTLG
jgi:hypothetical protein